ncbi:DUF2142 domain-containing protein [Acetobacter musti]|uniref:DUF2142 domain-containing protein n=1 Tax=Acetobacter musti TaxID=864732 RepID=A0ABX0JNJ1_9PROT|nr:DUF2142 domain-containing protein [Acetobacter musti]NHN84066.1 DUF2142 domain-containing protein [Acetobacter musti]
MSRIREKKSAVFSGVRFFSYALARVFTNCSLSRLYGLFMLVTGPLCILLTPPFQAPDEPNHYFRALQISHGRLTAVRRGDTEAGAYLPASVPRLSQIFDPLKFAPDLKVSPQMIEQAFALKHDSSVVFENLPNTALYPPTSYFGSALGIAAARAAGSGMLSTFYLSRAGNLILCVLLGMAAVRLAEKAAGGIAAPFLVIVLSLPMTIHLATTCSQDGVIIALSALACAGLLRLSEYPPGRWPWRLVALTGSALGCVIAAKSPYITLVLLPFLLRKHLFSLRPAILSLIAVSVFLLWFIGGLKPAMTTTPQQAGGSVALQARFLVHHPLQFCGLFFHTLPLGGRDNLHQFIGVLGWLDTPVPAVFRELAYGYLAATLSVIPLWLLALSRSASQQTPVLTEWRMRALRVFAASAALLAAFTGIYVALFLSWTRVGESFIDGVQGRYFLPLAMMLPLLPVIAFQPDQSGTPVFTGRWSYMPALRRAVTVAVAVFLLLTTITMYHTLGYRYWPSA